MSRSRRWATWIALLIVTGVNVYLYVTRPTPARVYVCVIHIPAHNGEKVTCR